MSNINEMNDHLITSPPSPAAKPSLNGMTDAFVGSSGSTKAVGVTNSKLEEEVRAAELRRAAAVAKLNEAMKAELRKAWKNSWKTAEGHILNSIRETSKKELEIIRELKNNMEKKESEHREVLAGVVERLGALKEKTAGLKETVIAVKERAEKKRAERKKRIDEMKEETAHIEANLHCLRNEIAVLEMKGMGEAVGCAVPFCS